MYTALHQCADILVAFVCNNAFAVVVELFFTAGYDLLEVLLCIGSE